VKREGDEREGERDERVKPVEPPGVLPGTPAGGSGGTRKSPQLKSERGFISRERRMPWCGAGIVPGTPKEAREAPPKPREPGSHT
jgi:hypothetical protein